MNNSTLKDLLKKYEQKRIYAELELHRYKKELNVKYPDLERVNSKINKIFIEISKELLINSASDKIKNLKSDLRLLKKEQEDLLKKYSISKLKPKYTCSKCNDTGYITKEDSTNMCKCLKQEIFNIEYNKSSLNNLETENFKTFNSNLFSDIANKELYKSTNSPRENILALKKTCEKFISNFSNHKEKNLLFVGTPGSGKTFLTNCVAYELLKNDKTILYQTSQNLFDKLINQRFGKESFDANLSNNILNVDLLIIDDLGTESTTAITMLELFNIINSRMINNKKTIISSNLLLNELAAKYDERTMSRIAGSYTICKFFGNDLRRKK